MAVRCIAVMRGTKAPLLVEVTSSIADGSAGAPVPMLTPFCAKPLWQVANTSAAAKLLINFKLLEFFFGEIAVCFMLKIIL
jgi:hypothetical protein